jgi:hypothetical protein
MIEKIKDKYFKKLCYLSYLILGFGLAACTQNKDEGFTYFNTTYGPEYQLSKTDLSADLLVNWQGNPPRGVAPLHLKIPVAYLMHALDDQGRFETVTWALEPMRNGSIDRIEIVLRRSNGEPVPNTSTKKYDPPELLEKKMQDWEDGYQVYINKYLRFDSLTYREDLYTFRDLDVAGLESHKNLDCYDIDKLKKDIKSEVYDYKNEILGRLTNRTEESLMPDNCLTNEVNPVWLSPADTHVDQAVYIQCGTVCTMSFLYKNRNIQVISIKGRHEFVRNWKFYHKQVFQLLNRFDVQ